jgi:glycosyltransferase A (GT-A) superfamily protein (DUF2064 family)
LTPEADLEPNRSPTRGHRGRLPLTGTKDGHGERAATPTLLVFTVGPEAEARRRPLLPAPLRAEEVGLRQACFAATLRAGRDAGCLIVVSSPEPLEAGADAAWIPQRGATFGERLEDALATAFRSAPGPVVLVGTDIPGLDGERIREALAALGRDPSGVVLGPAQDGGFYLLAARRPLHGVLESVHWCGPETLATLRRELARAGRPVALVGALSDLDAAADLDRWLAAPPPGDDRGSGLRSCHSSVRRLLAERRRPALEAPERRSSAERPRRHEGRAPPFPASC